MLGSTNEGRGESEPPEETVHIVDDDRTVIVTLTALLRSEGIRVAGYQSAAEFLRSNSSLSRGCLLIDVHMDGMSGLELQEQLFASDISLPVIMITGGADVATAVQAMKRGAIDFIEKPFTHEMLMGTIRRALSLDRQVNAQRVGALMISNRLSILTERERAVVEAAALGHSTKEIARILGISPRTVDAHRANILRKLEVKSISDLLRVISPLRLLPGP